MFCDSRHQAVTCGGRLGAHLIRIAACLAALALGSPALGAAQDAPAITVSETSGLYSVTATFTVPQPPSMAMAVLTDYPAIPRFMPDVRTSVVVERSGGHVVVQQEAMARFMMFSKRIHLLLEIDEEADTIRFRDRCGKSFSRYEGRWTIGRTGGETRVTYALTAKPSFDVPEFLLKRLLKRDATRMIDGLKAEIATRALPHPRPFLERPALAPLRGRPQ
jgi:ribosome-associated toxin RatA of RatAB toxin-antitoxin module